MNVELVKFLMNLDGMFGSESGRLGNCVELQES